MGYVPTDSRMLARTDARGTALYSRTDSGNIRRRRKIPKATRRAVLERDGHACLWCGATQWLELDHVVRYADGGSDDPSNLRTLCETCHRSRGRN